MTEIRISVRNTSADGGNFLTPVYFGAHDGTYDIFDVGQGAPVGLERLAEDGNFSVLRDQRLAADADSQGAVVFGAGGPLATQELGSTRLDVDGISNGYINFASMIIPSNDAFIGNDDALQIFDASGAFVGETTIEISGEDVYDAGTEVNTELDAAFINQTGPNTGLDENGVVQLHEGFNGSLGNPDGAQIILGGTNAAGQFIDPTAADFTQPGAQIAEIHINTVRDIAGTGASEVIEGGADDDIVSAGAGSDTVNGADGWDELSGEAGNDVLNGGVGSDILDGGRGFDSASYADASELVVADLLRSNLNTGEAVGDVYQDIEGIIGSDFDDILRGDNGRNALRAGDGDDTLNGRAGDDLLEGGSGEDRLTGGAGADQFLFRGASNEGADTITDFTSGTDTVLLRGVNFGGLEAGTLSSANFALDAAGDRNDFLIFDQSSNTLLYDADGNGAGVGVEIASFSNGAILSAADIEII